MQHGVLRPGRQLLEALAEGLAAMCLDVADRAAVELRGREFGLVTLLFGASRHGPRHVPRLRQAERAGELEVDEGRDARLPRTRSARIGGNQAFGGRIEETLLVITQESRRRRDGSIGRVLRCGLAVAARDCSGGQRERCCLQETAT